MEEEEELKSDIPDTLLAKLFDASGTTKGCNKGYYLFYINKQGNPTCVSKLADPTTRLALSVIIKDCQGAFDDGEEDYD